MNIVINNRKTGIIKLHQQHETLSVMGMPGVGISLFLRELAKTDIGHPVYIDVFALPSLSAEELLSSLAKELGARAKGLDRSGLIRECINSLEILAKKHKRIVIYFAGFDQLLPVLDGELLQNLQSLARSCHGSVKLVFGLCVSLKKLVPDNLFDTGLRLFGNFYYLKPYTIDELRYLLTLYGPPGWDKTPDLNKKLEFCGGHFQLLLTLLGDKPEISDRMSEPANLLFKNLYQHLLGPQKTIVRNLANGNKYVAYDEYLNGIGMVADNHSLFSPLFADYLAGINIKRLPVKEQRLYLLLKKNSGQIVPKQEIMDVVWPDEVVSDWALSALVYRLRKHPAFLAKNLVLENHKKVGYLLRKV